MKKLTATLLSLLMLIAALGGCRPKDAEERAGGRSLCGCLLTWNSEVMCLYLSGSF